MPGLFSQIAPFRKRMNEQSFCFLYLRLKEERFCEILAFTICHLNQSHTNGLVLRSILVTEDLIFLHLCSIQTTQLITEGCPNTGVVDVLTEILIKLSRIQH